MVVVETTVLEMTVLVMAMLVMALQVSDATQMQSCACVRVDVCLANVARRLLAVWNELDGHLLRTYYICQGAAVKRHYRSVIDPP